MLIRPLILCLLSCILSACSSLEYYSQSIRGQLSLMSKQVPIRTVLESKDTKSQLRKDLLSILAIREFASNDLLLPDNKSYESYVDLERKFVVWNVFATPEFSLQPVTSCFLLVGCLQYKGFFKQQDAINFAQTLRTSDHDVFIGGVSAYSTLGWFNDPVLSSMLNYGELRSAEVIFHELAHQLIYIKDDSAFNEAFATTVGQEGVRRWLTVNQRSDDLQKFQHDQAWEEVFLKLVMDSKEKLETLYSSAIKPPQMRKEKQAVLTELQQNYRVLKSSGDNPSNYGSWIDKDLNNAKISSVVTYFDRVDAFLNLLDMSGSDLALFYQRVRYLGNLTKEQRDNCLENLTSSPICIKQ